MADAMKKHPEVDVLINFASLRSAYDSTVETMSYAQVDRGAWQGGGGSRESSIVTASLDKGLGALDRTVIWVKVVGGT